MYFLGNIAPPPSKCIPGLFQHQFVSSTKFLGMAGKEHSCLKHITVLSS